MKNVIFLGPPGCGKGTQADRLISALGYIQVSTGNLLRNIAKQKDAFGEKIQRILSQGILVDDEIVNQLIDDFYEKIGSVQGVVLDGYPRSIKQAESLEVILKKCNSKIDAVFYFNIAEDILVKRIVGRYTCANCGAIYNKFFSNTKIPGQCDKCKSDKFNERSDDSEAVIVERLKVFNHTTAPLLDYYADKLIKLEADQSVDSLSTKILESL